MAAFSPGYARTVQRLRVPLGFVLAASMAWFSHPTARTLLAAVPLCVAGLTLRSWAAGHLRKNQTLAVSGPYAWMRNPLYAGSLLLAGGFVVGSGNPWLGLLFGAAFVLVYLPVIQQEEEHLAKLFPEFRAYATQVPLLWPKAPRMRTGERFSPSLWRTNEEYKALAATVTGFVLLALKAVGS